MLIILGSPNDAEGNLLPMAKGRLDKGIEIFREQIEECNILLTGGFGAHFNTTTYPHAYYAKQYLLSKGIAEEVFTELALSCDTVDDAKKCVPIIEKYNPKKMVVVSSDFHINRVKFIFKTIFPNRDLEFQASEYIAFCTNEKINKLEEHETKELESLKTRGRSKLMDIAL
jgi:vancomycin permeability regulator SanA